jgi:RNA polymerase sigma-70 factor (ECF subfamily)
LTPQAEALFKQFQRDRVHLLAYIRMLTRDAELSEDIFQEVSVIVLQKLNELCVEGDFSAWCRGVARNLVRRERTRSRRHPALIVSDNVLELIDQAFDENQASEQLEQKKNLLRGCVNEISGSNRDLLNLRYTADLSLREIASRLNRTEASVQVALSRVRKALIECIQRKKSVAYVE